MYIFAWFQNGTYGFNCSEVCSCKDSTYTCNSISGKCISGTKKQGKMVIIFFNL